VRKKIRKLKRVFLPKWFGWFILLILVPIIIVIEYEAFFGSDARPILGAVFGFIFTLIIAMVFLVSYGRLPYALIEG